MADAAHRTFAKLTADRLRRHRQRWTETLLLAGITGIVTGFAVALFDIVVASTMLERVLQLPPAALAVAPAIGLLLAWAVLRWLGRSASSSTSDEYVKNFHERDRLLDLRSFPAKILASVATLGFGGSLGFEGPSIYLGAGIGSWLQRRFRRVFSVEDTKLLLAVGAAAGVAAIFKTPLTGALFALEVPYQQDQARRVALPALIGAVASYVTFVLIRGTQTLIPVRGAPGFDLPDLVGALIVGILCGVGARAFVWVIIFAKSLRARVPDWISTLSSGVVLGALALTTIWLFDDPLSIGPGYAALRWAERPNVTIGLIAALFLIRALASATTLAGGGAGGLFIPLVVQGALLGRFVAAVAQIQQVTLLPLVGAAAFLGAGYRVPIAAVVFVAEASGRPGFIVPGVLATVVAQLLMGDVSVTPYQIRMRGGHVEQRLRMRVSEAMQERWTPLHIDLPLEGRVDSAFVTSRALSLPVVDDDGKYRGMVRLADVSAVRARQREGERVQDLLVEAPGASAQETLLEAVATMDAAELDSLAVTTPDGMVIGVVTLDDALRLDEIVARSRDAAGGGASRGR